MQKFLTVGFYASILATVALAMSPTDSFAQGSTANGSDRPLIKVVQAMPAKDINFVPWYFAKQQGFYAAEGLDVQLPSMGTPAAIAALINKEIQFASGTSAIRAARQGAPLKVVMYSLSRFPFVAVAGGNIKSYKDLNGKLLASAAVGGADDIIVKKLMEREKVTDFKVIPLGFTAMRATALSGGKIDFTLLDPLGAYFMEKQGMTILGPVDDINPQPSGGFAVNADSLVNNPDMVRKWLRATLKAMLVIKSNPEGVADYAAKEFDTDRDLALKALRDNDKFYNGSDLGGATEADLFEIIKADDELTMKSSGDPLAVGKQLHDFKLLHEVQRELGIPCKTGYECR
jgi:NitT/TauT family transport system substrate-binding protein